MALLVSDCVQDIVVIAKSAIRVLEIRYLGLGQRDSHYRFREGLMFSTSVGADDDWPFLSAIGR